MDKKIQEEISKMMRRNGSKGGKTTVKKYGKDYMSALVKARWAKAKKSVDKSA